MAYCIISPEKLYCGPLNHTNINRKPNETLKDFLARKFKHKIEHKQFLLPEDSGKRYEDIPTRRLQDVTTPEQQTNIKKAINTIVNAYGNEQAGIAFISRYCFYQLSKEKRGGCSWLGNCFDNSMEIIKKFPQNENKTDAEIFNQTVANCINSLNICKLGWGACIEKGKVSPEMFLLRQSHKVDLFHCKNNRN